MKLKITVHGVAYEVDVEVLDAKRDEFGPTGALPSYPQQAGPSFPAAGYAPAPAPAPASASTANPSVPTARPAVGSNGVTSPIAGTVVEIKCKPGDMVSSGQELLIIEAMKMNTSICSPQAGRVKAIMVAAGDSVRENQQLVEYE